MWYQRSKKHAKQGRDQENGALEILKHFLTALGLLLADGIAVRIGIGMV